MFMQEVYFLYFLHFCPKLSSLSLSLLLTSTLCMIASQDRLQWPIEKCSLQWCPFVWKAKVCGKLVKEGGKGEGHRVCQPPHVTSPPSATTLKEDGDSLWLFFTLQLNIGFVWDPVLLFLISLKLLSALLPNPVGLAGKAGLALCPLLF